jgi:hypothetical protein
LLFLRTWCGVRCKAAPDHGALKSPPHHCHVGISIWVPWDFTTCSSQLPHDMSRRMLCQLWRLPASVRSLTLSSCRRHSSVPPSCASEPLRILFCGSDHFSIASLRGLAEAKRTRPGLIHSIDVLHRPAKRTGRGLKIKTEGSHVAPL